MTLNLSMPETKTLEEEYFQKFVDTLIKNQENGNTKYPFQIEKNESNHGEAIITERVSGNSEIITRIKTIKELQQFLYSRREQIIEEGSCNMSMADFFRDLEKQVLRTSVFSSGTESIIEDYSLRRREKVCNAIRDKYISPSGKDILEKSKEEENSDKATTYDIERILSHTSDPMQYRKIVRLYSKLNNPNNLLRFFQTVASSNDKNFTPPLMVANIFDGPSFQELLVFFNTFTYKEIIKIINSEEKVLQKVIRNPEVQNAYKAIIKFASNTTNSDETEAKLTQTCLEISPSFMMKLIQRVKNQATLAEFIEDLSGLRPDQLTIIGQTLTIFGDGIIAELIDGYGANRKQLNILFNRSFNDKFLGLSRRMLTGKYREKFIEVIQNSCKRKKVEDLLNIKSFMSFDLFWLASAKNMVNSPHKH